MFISHVEGVESLCYMLDTASCMVHYKVISNVKCVKYIRLHLGHLFLILKVLKVLHTYINRMKPLPQYVHTDNVLYYSSFFII